MTKLIKPLSIFIILLTLQSCSGNKADEVSSIPQTLAELSGKKVGVQTGTLYEIALLEKNPDIKVEFYSDFNTMILATEQGKLDAYLSESISFKLEQTFHPGLEAMPEEVETYEFGLAFGNTPHKNTLCRQINEFIEKCLADGTKEQIQTYWFDEFDMDSCEVDKNGITGENGILRIAIEGGYIPVSYRTSKGYQGFDVDFIYRFCREYGYTPEFNEMTYDAIPAALASGKFDIGTNIMKADERNDALLISDTYLTYSVVVGVFIENTEKSNLISKIRTSFFKTFIKESRWKMFVEGITTTFTITLLSLLAGTAIGFSVFLFCRNGNILANKTTGFIIWLIHGTPAVLFIMILYYIVFAKVRIAGITVAVIGFSLIFACTMFDMLESGTRAVGKSQLEAARAQGFSDSSAFFRVILPQAMLHFLPSYKTEIITLIKETSIVGYIAVQDLTKMSDLIRSHTFEAFFPLISTAIIYFILANLMIFAVSRIEVVITPHKRSLKHLIKEIE